VELPGNQEKSCLVSLTSKNICSEKYTVKWGFRNDSHFYYRKYYTTDFKFNLNFHHTVKKIMTSIFAKLLAIDVLV
jgi:hypothetical protein